MDASFLDLILDKISHLEGSAAYTAIFSVLFACGLGLPIPEDITLFAAGYLSYLENIELHWAIVVCMVGVLLGDFTLFTIGRVFGKRVLSLPGVRYVMTPARIALAQAKLKKNARKVCFVARFLAGLRAPIYFSAGMLGVRPLTFFTLDSLAALISVPALTYLGFYFGDEIEIGLLYMRRAERYIMITLAVIGLLVVLNILRKKMKMA
ncbi:MAG: DedA family protein [Oligoflexia bacterium]|nr:DedA family protein [Oligoflexia bacterium]